MAALGLAVLGAGLFIFVVPHNGTLTTNEANSAACASASPVSATGTATAGPTSGAQTTATAAPAASGPAGTATAAPAPTGPAGTATAAPAPTGPAGTATATAAPTATATATAAPTASATPCPTASATASAMPSATATAPVAAANTACVVIVPANPLSARGLSTPYQLTGPAGMTPDASGCTMANNGSLGAFVQATILNPATGALSVYEPLIVTQGTTPAVAPVVPRLPRNAVVTIDIGFNGTTLTQQGATANALRQGNCVDGLGSSAFGQVSFCNGINFFRAAQRAENRGLLKVPAIGTSPVTGKACPTTRDFTIIDQDQSDNVTSKYLVTASGQTAQFNQANVAALPDAQTAVNGSDNALLSDFVDPALGCQDYEAPDLSQGGTMSTSQALNELSAAAHQQAPVALVPENDEMVLVGDAVSLAKTNLYRMEVGMPTVSRANNASSSPANYCQNMVNVQTPFLAATQDTLAGNSSPVPAVGNNLFTFLANRLSMSFANLNCQNYGLTDPVTVTLDANGVATAATFNTDQQTASAPAGGDDGSMPGMRHRIGRRHHRFDNPSGM